MIPLCKLHGWSVLPLDWKPEGSQRGSLTCNQPQQQETGWPLPSVCRLNSRTSALTHPGQQVAPTSPPCTNKQHFSAVIFQLQRGCGCWASGRSATGENVFFDLGEVWVNTSDTWPRLVSVSVRWPKASFSLRGSAHPPCSEKQCIFHPVSTFDPHWASAVTRPGFLWAPRGGSDGYMEWCWMDWQNL